MNDNQTRGMAEVPDFEIKSGGGDLFHPKLSPEAAKTLLEGLTFRPANPMAEVLRRELAKGSYQMVTDTLPYETQAARIAAALSAAGFGDVREAGALALEEAATNILTNDPLDYWAGHLPEGLGFQEAMSLWLKAHAAAVRGEG